MAAPEYLIKLKFSTDVDKKAFNELSETYNNLSKKQQGAFAKQYGMSIKEANDLFQKETQRNLKAYEKAAIKTEQNLTAARVKELRNYIQKRNDQLKALPGFAAGAIGSGALLVANSAINSSFGLTEFEKNTATGVMNSAYAGRVAGFYVAGPLGAMVGGAVGAATGWIISKFENSSEGIKRSSELFNQAVNTYRTTLEFTAGMNSGMAGAGFDDVGQYQVYKQALKVVGIDNDSFMNDLARSLAADKNSAALGRTLINARRDQGLELLYQQWLKSGMGMREFIMGSTASGGLNQSDSRADALIALFQAGGMQAAINRVLEYTSLAPGENASALSAQFNDAFAKRQDLMLKEWAGDVDALKEIQHINMNDDIMEEHRLSMLRDIKLMEEGTILLAGINKTYRLYEKQLRQIFGYITGETDVGTNFGRGASAALQAGGVEGLSDYFANPHGYPMSKAEPMMSRIDSANDKISMSRIENKPTGIGGF